MGNRTYKVGNGGVIISTAITIIQIKAGDANPFEITRATITQGLSELSTMESIQIIRKSLAATVTASTPILMDPDDSASEAVGGTAATGITATAEGTDTDILVDESFNILNGWNYIPVPEERPRVIGGGIIALLFPVAPASATWRANIYFREL